MAAIRGRMALSAALVVVALAACGAPAPTTGHPSTATRPSPSPEATPRTTAATQPARRSAALQDQIASEVSPPARLEIPDLGIDVSVRAVGLDAQGRMGLFDDPAIAAWYQWGSAPASPAGSTVIAAHVDSLEYDLLPFARLKDAVAGTQVVVTDAAGVRHGYSVQTIEVTGKADVDWAAAFDRAGPPRLTLVTCGGEFDAQNRRYLSNLVLTAAPIG